jgi:type II secretory pathway component GspD/PulD (secretin)
MDKEPMFPQTDVRQFLLAVEPDYDKAAQLGLAILPELGDMIEKNEPQLTPRAAYLVGMLASQNVEALPKILELLDKAAHSELPTVRIAVAATAEHLPAEHAVTLLQLLIQDDDLSVRKFAMRSAPLDSPPQLVERIKEWAQTEELPEMRALAQEVLESMKQK